MLKTNSKKVSEAVRAYIAKNTNGYDDEKTKTFEEAAAVIAKTWGEYKYPGLAEYKKHNLLEAFKDFANGLPNDLFDYIAVGDTVKLVGDMLEQTEAERAKYTDSQACDLHTYLIYREISKAVEIGF